MHIALAGVCVRHRISDGRVIPVYNALRDLVLAGKADSARTRNKLRQLSALAEEAANPTERTR